MARRCLVISGPETPKVFELLDDTLNKLPERIDDLWLLFVAVGWDDRCDTRLMRFLMMVSQA